MDGLGVSLGCGPANCGQDGAAGGGVVWPWVLGLALALVLGLYGLPSGAVAAFAGLYSAFGPWGHEVGNDDIRVLHHEGSGMSKMGVLI